MAISADYVTLCKQIADELGDRQDLLTPLADSNLSLSPIKNAIQSAIAKWEREPFYFNSVYDTPATPFFTTVAGQEFYTVDDASEIATSPDLLKLHVLINANRYPLEPRTWQYLEDTSVNPAVTGFPFDYAYFAEQLRFYPIPDGAYPITRSGTKRLSALVEDSDANAWTQDAYDLIRSEAKLILALETLHDDAMAARTRVAIYGDPSEPRSRGYLAALKGETTRRQARGRIRPTYF